MVNKQYLHFLMRTGLIGVNEEANELQIWVIVLAIYSFSLKPENAARW